MRFEAMLCAACLWGCATDAIDDGAVEMDTEALMAAQAPLVEVATRIQALAEADASLGGIVLDAPHHRIEVWWKGDAPASLRQQIASATTAGVCVDLGKAAFAQSELIAAAHRIFDERGAFPGLHAVGPRPDGSGLEVAVDEASSAGDIFDAVRGDIPVHVTAEPRFQPTGRLDDTAPFSGGGRAEDLTFTNCTTGFAVHRTVLWFETSRGILTAEHCHLGGNVSFFSGGGLLIGKAEPAPTFNPSSGFNHTDSLYITASSRPRIFDGPIGPGEFTKSVVGMGSNFVGLFVCQSGATSGTHCNTQINTINRNITLSNGQLLENASLANEVSGGMTHAAGDSGGPVFTLSGPSNVNAVGIISAGQNPIACPPGITSCFNQLVFSPIGNVLINQNASLVTL